MPEITIDIPADIAERVAALGCSTPEIYYRLLQLGLKKESK